MNRVRIRLFTVLGQLKSIFELTDSAAGLSLSSGQFHFIF